MSKANRDSAVLIAAYIATSVLNYAFGVILSWFFAPSDYGILGVSQSLLLLTALVAGAGFTWTAAQDLALRGLTADTRLRFRTAFLANTFLGLLMGLSLWIAYLTGWLPLGVSYGRIVPLIGITTVLLSARGVVNGAARGIYKFNAVGLNLVLEVVVKALVGIILVVTFKSATGVIASFAIGAAASLLHSLWIVRPARLWEGGGWIARGVVRVTLPLFLGMLGTALMLNLDVLGLKLISGPLMGDQLVGYYQAAVILARTPVFIAQALTLVLFSYVAGTRGNEQTGFGERLAFFRTGIKSWLRLLLPISVVLFLAPRSVLSIFFPAHYAASARALQIAAVGGAILALVTLQNGVLQAAGERRKTVLAAGLATLLQLVVLIWAVPRFGVEGAALSLVVAGSTALAILAPLVYRTAFQVSPGKIEAPSILSLLKNMTPLVGVAIPLVFLPDGHRIEAVIKISLAGIFYLAALFAIHHQPRDESRPLYTEFVRFMRVLIGD
jgi:O-antigen/teichoic acid export membrane protein